LQAEIELQAHRYNSQLQTMQIGFPSEQDGIIHKYERRVRGWRTGIYDGAVLLPFATSSVKARLRLDALTSALSDTDVITLRILGTEAVPTETVDNPSPKDQSSAGETAQQYRIREVMPLADTYERYLRGLGKHTRRNIVHCQTQARRDAIKFDFTIAVSAVDRSRLSALAKLNMPFATKPRRLMNVIQFLASQAQPFQAYLTRLGDDHPFSITGGFIEGDLALMTYQINIRSSRTLSPSLMLRSFLVQALIERGVRNLAFVGGCAGLLYHQCTAVPAGEVLLVRRTFIGRTKHLACSMIADSKNRITRLTPQLFAVLCAVGNPLKELIDPICS
jgi:hypothetical protein